jgi:hypothetical protein
MPSSDCLTRDAERFSSVRFSSSAATFGSFLTAGGTAFSGLSPRRTVTSGFAWSSIDSVTVTPSSVTLSGPCARSAYSRASIAHSSRIGSG